MANTIKEAFLGLIANTFGTITKLPNSNSLFEIGDGTARIYVRYSKLHPADRTFFGLRHVDLQQLSGRLSFIAFLTDSPADASTPVIIPYSDFEHVFHMASPAADGQYKVQLLKQVESLDLYIASQGRFNVDGFRGLGAIERAISTDKLRPNLNLQHSQVQTLLAAIGKMKGFDVFVPDNNVNALDWTLCQSFDILSRLPACYDNIVPIISEVDVIWVQRGATKFPALFEVEHSTPIYSGLLRFNDLLLSSHDRRNFYIVSNDTRRDLFARQLSRPTFRCSGLAEHTSFLDYPNVYDWFMRLMRNHHADKKQ